MKGRHRIRAIGNLVLFQLLWFSTVFGAAAGDLRAAAVVLVLYLAWGPLRGGSARADLLVAVFGTLLGLLVELFWILPGLIDYRLQPVGWLAPPWVLFLWVGLAVSFRYGLCWLQRRPVLASLFGASGGAVSMMAGLRMGAAEAPLGVIPLLTLYALSWAALAPLLARVAEMAGRPDVAPGHSHGRRQVR